MFTKIENISNKISRDLKRRKVQTVLKMRANCYGILPREWVPIHQPGNKYNVKNIRLTNCNKFFRLLSYNILAQDLLIEHMQIYSGIKYHLLLWQHRLRRLKNEINKLRPDILCLQEVQYDHLKGLVSELQGRRCFEYVFKKKSGHRTDGCAILYDRSKLHLISECPIEYFTKGNALLNRENVALLAKFQVRCEPQTQFIVATTHLIYNPRREDVRTAQVQVLIRSLLDFSVPSCCLPSNNQRLPIILTGDFNFTSQSSTYQILTSPLDLTEYQASSTTATATATTTAAAAGTNTNAHNDTFQLVPINFGEDCASTYQDAWTTVDHIFYSIASDCPKYLKIFNIYKLPSIDNLNAHGKLPSGTQGSDHLPLVLTFTII